MTTFEEALYSNDSIPDVLDAYAGMLRTQGGNRNFLHATKILEYKGIINARSHTELRRIFDKFYNLLLKETPELRFRLAGRRKSLISIEQKIRRNLGLNKSLDLIRDMLGVRIILLNGNPEDCYTVLEKLISCCITEGFTICEENSHNSEESLLSSKSPILGHFYYGITDYIGDPKESGYQSLHATFRNSSGFCFEVQVRTFDMHCNSINGTANHNDYKESKYEVLKFDRSKIQIPGYYSSSDGSSIIDLIGLENSLEVLQRNKSF